MSHPGMYTSKILDTQHVATRRNRVAKCVHHVVPNDVVIYVCCVQMLQSFGQSWQMLSKQYVGMAEML